MMSEGTLALLVVIVAFLVLGVALVAAMGPLLLHVTQAIP